MFLILLAANATVWLASNNLGLIPGRGGIARSFGFDFEWNVPTLFNFLLIIQAFLLCFMASLSEFKNSYWKILGVVFLVLSADELFSYHEHLSLPVRDLLGISGFFYFAWIVPGALFVLILAALGVRWLRSLPNQTRWGFMIAAVMYLIGVFMLEGVGGWYGSKTPGLEDTLFWLITSAEESLEMLGLIVFGFFAALHIAADQHLATSGLQPDG